MTLRLVASDNERALAIRDHLVPIVREHGTLEIQRDTVRLTVLEMDGWTLRHWTPFNELSSAEASSPGYRHAVEHQRTQATLPYGLEVWYGQKVLTILWAADGAFEISHFLRGTWEDEALAF